MTKERLVEFLKENVFCKYKDNLIVLDNAGSHRNEYVKQAILESGNKYLFSVPYTPKTNVIEMVFNQIKHYLKLNKKVLKYPELKREVGKAISTKINNNKTNTSWIYINQLSNDIARDYDFTKYRLYKTLDDNPNFMY